MSATELLAEKVRKLDEHTAREVLVFLEQRDAEEVEDRLDVEAARQARAEPGENVPWSRVKAENGLT